MKRILIALLIVLFFGAGANLVAEEAGSSGNFKFAWIDLEKVIQGYYKNEPIVAKLEKEKEEKEEEIKKLIEEIKVMEGKMALMTESGRRKQEKEIARKRLAVSTLIQEAERDLGLLEIAEMEKMIEEVKERAAKLAEKNGYTFIFLSNTILYKDPALDLTEKLLEELNKKKDD